MSRQTCRLPKLRIGFNFKSVFRGAHPAVKETQYRA